MFQVFRAGGCKNQSCVDKHMAVDRNSNTVVSVFIVVIIIVTTQSSNMDLQFLWMYIAVSSVYPLRSIRIYETLRLFQFSFSAYWKVELVNYLSEINNLSLHISVMVNNRLKWLHIAFLYKTKNLAAFLELHRIVIYYSYSV